MELFIQETISPVTGSGFQLLKRRSRQSNKTSPSLLRLIQSVTTQVRVCRGGSPGQDLCRGRLRSGQGDPLQRGVLRSRH